MVVMKIIIASIVLLGIVSGGIVGMAVAHEHETAWVVGLIVGDWIGLLVGCMAGVSVAVLIYWFRELVCD